MPYRKKVFRSRRYGRRRKVPWYNKKYSVAQVASKAFKGVKYIKSLINCEKHTFDWGVSAGDIKNDGSNFDHLTAIAQGDTDVTRTGLSILGQNLLIKGYVSVDADATASEVRIMVIRDKQQVSDTPPTIASLLDSSFANYTVAPLQRGTYGRYDILYDRTLTVVKDTEAETKHFKIWLKTNQHVRFNGINSTDIQKGGIYLFYVSNEAVNYPVITYYSRYRFTDN